MADLKQFDIQRARDAGYSGAEIQLHLIHALGYPLALASQAITALRKPTPDPDTTYADQFLRPVAQSRITQTPIYNADTDAQHWPASQGGMYNPELDRIEVRPSLFQSDPNTLIPHESAHAIYQKANLNPPSVFQAQVPSLARVQAGLGSQQSQANEGLAYSIGTPDATAFIERVAGQVSDPTIAQQLRRLHYNALGTRQLASGNAKPGPYITSLSPPEEAQFQSWVKNNRIPFDPSPMADYDMRGFWRSMLAGQSARSTTNLHFPDTFKTPYHQSFSNESMYATGDAPHWEGNRLVDKSGKVVFDESKTTK